MELLDLAAFSLDEERGAALLLLKQFGSNLLPLPSLLSFLRPWKTGEILTRGWFEVTSVFTTSSEPPSLAHNSAFLDSSKYFVILDLRELHSDEIGVSMPV